LFFLYCFSSSSSNGYICKKIRFIPMPIVGISVGGGGGHFLLINQEETRYNYQ
jgi:hypothetical protein